MNPKIIHDLQDLRYLSWAKIRNSSGTAGSFLKAYDSFGQKKKYYKLSNFNSLQGIIGHECVNEIIVDRLLTLLGIPHLEYQLIHAAVVIDDMEYETYLCASEDFKQTGESKIALETYFQTERQQGEKLLDFCLRNGWEEYIYRMLLVDYLIINRDRHGANIEVLRNRQEKSIRLAPLFDQGLSLAFSSITEDALSKVDVLGDPRVQCCVGSGSTKENLSLIPKDYELKITPLKESDKKILMDGLEGILPRPWQDKIWEMIWLRWQAYEDFCNQR